MLLHNFFNKYFFSVILKNGFLIIVYQLKSKHFLQFLLLFFKNSLFYCYKFLIDLVIVDNLSNFNYRFKLSYVLASYYYKTRTVIFFYLKYLENAISIYKLFKCSLWIEREIYDMYGIKFFNNFDLRRILNDYTFFSYPLKKDFPLSGFLEINYSEHLNLIKEFKTELMQEFRFLQESSPLEDWDQQDLGFRQSIDI